MYQHRTHTPHADGLASLGEIVLQGFLVQHHSGNIGDGEMDGVSFHDVLTLDGGEHAVSPTEPAAPLILDGSGGNQLDMRGKKRLGVFCLLMR